jgi:hypothetical protein
MKKILVYACWATLASATSVSAQKVEHIQGREIEITGHIERSHENHMAGRDGNAGPTRPDVHSALTQAGKAWDIAIANYRQAVQNHKDAVAALDRFKDKYTDANGNALSGWTQDSVKSIIGKLETDERSTLFDMKQAETALNNARSNAERAYREASAENAREQSPAPSQSQHYHGPDH